MSVWQTLLDNFKQWFSGRTQPTTPTPPVQPSNPLPVPPKQPYNPPPVQPVKPYNTPPYYGNQGHSTPFGPVQPWTPTMPPAPKPPPPAPTGNPSVDNEQMVAALLAVHNRWRQDFRQPSLSLNNQLINAAQRHADWMAKNRDMDHTEHPGLGFDAADFFTRIQNEDYNPRVAGENIAAGQTSVDQVMAAWMQSPGHRTNILSSECTEVGFGVAQDDYGHTYWCAVFAAPLNRLGRALREECFMSIPPALVHDPSQK